MVKLVRPKPKIPSPGKRSDPLGEFLSNIGPVTRTYPEFAIPKRGTYDLSVTPEDIETVRSKEKEQTKRKTYDRYKYLTYPSPWGGHKDKPNEEDKPKPFPPYIPRRWPTFPPPEEQPWPVIPPPDVIDDPYTAPTDPYEDTPKEPPPEEEEWPRPELPDWPPCSDDPIAQQLFGLPPCNQANETLRIQTTRKHGQGPIFQGQKGRKSRFWNHPSQTRHSRRRQYSRHYVSQLRQSNAGQSTKVHRGSGRGIRVRWYKRRYSSPLF